METGVPHRKAQCAGIVLGIGLGGFVDGIVLHQILQWHNMVSNWLPPTTLEAMHVNMVWDGLFHAVVWLVTLVGVLLLWSAAYQRERIPPLREFVGRLICGWGWFNLVEGLIDHQLLGIHHVNEVVDVRYRIYWDIGFIAWGAAMLVAGWLLMRRGQSESRVGRRDAK